MECSSLYTIALRTVPSDGTTLSWHLGDDFFEALDQHEIEHGSLDATLRVRQKAGAYELDIALVGQVEIPCDRCLEPMLQEIDAQCVLKVRLGDVFDDDGDIITVAADKAELDLAWNLYEIVVLGIPIHHAHPDGQCPVDVPFLVGNEPEAAAQPKSDNPFAKLKELMGQEGEDNK